MVKSIVKVFLSLYRFLFSFLINKGNCNFFPTCSFFATGSLKKHFILNAFLLIFRRILKCNAFGFKGYDPIPFCFYLI
jgi:putative membrane protein insertion efficiency factor